MPIMLSLKLARMVFNLISQQQESQLTRFPSPAPQEFYLPLYHKAVFCFPTVLFQELTQLLLRSLPITNADGALAHDVVNLTVAILSREAHLEYSNFALL